MNFLDAVISEINRLDKNTKIKNGDNHSFATSMERLVRSDPWDTPRVTQSPLILKFCIKCKTRLITEGVNRNIPPSYLKKSYYLCNGCSATKVRERYQLHHVVIKKQKAERRRKMKLAKLLGVVNDPSS
jgi:hypothetical protein